MEPVDIRPLTLANAIRHMREKAGLSARALSLKARLSSSYVGKLESGEIEPSVRAFARIALSLGLTREEVFLIICMEGLTGSPGLSDP